MMGGAGHRRWSTGSRWLARHPHTTAFVAGAISTLAFAPFDVAPLAWLLLAVLFRLWADLPTPRRGLTIGWSYGLGLFGFGVWWLHISIDQFGNVGFPLAMLITLAFVAGMAGFAAVAGWLGSLIGGSSRTLLMWATYPSAWVLMEWLRGWVLTGFPWLALGYSQLGWPLAGFAPVLGIFGVSLALALTAGGGGWCAGQRGARRIGGAAVLIALWSAGALLAQHSWTAPSGPPLQVSIIQGNVRQELKWHRDELLPTLALYQNLTEAHWDSAVIIWPETAVPALYGQVERNFLAPLQEEARAKGSAILLGIPVRDREHGRYFNSMIVLDEHGDRYDKRHLVPFGEFLPAKALLAPVLDWLTIPMSDFTPGNAERPLVRLGPYLAGVSICYEDAFGDEVAQALPDAAFLVNASNDAWFGDSLAPPQHLQIARMRALETGRYLVRATNTGISALIDTSGSVVQAAPPFQRQVLTVQVQPRSGATPYVVAGNGPVVMAVLLLLAGAWPAGRWAVVAPPVTDKRKESPS